MSPRSRLRNITTGETLTETAFLFTSFWGRFWGMLSPALPAASVVGMSPCDWIHTFGLGRPLDIAYCDAGGRVLQVTLAQPPNRLPRRVNGARTTWEADAGVFAGRISTGDILQAEAMPQTAEGAN